ncbi:MAG: DUF935 domain-containing protein [Chitinophagaceae bacterium]|nr:DUF935 domain-containing protein [Chitinophagaceae bacterium]
MNILKKIFLKKQSAPSPPRNYAAAIAPKSVSMTRHDIAAWQAALRAAEQAENPRRHKLINLYHHILLDALLSSQINNRLLQTLGSSFVVVDNQGNELSEITQVLSKSKWFITLIKEIILSQFYGYTLVELLPHPAERFEAVVIPHANIDPKLGRFFPDYSKDNHLLYRTLPEFNLYLFEFNTGELGLLNKAVPCVLFKKFATSCWSELCEIYGIPPRVLKTNTQDNAMLARAEQMMKDMGAASWFIIDETESFEFAQGVPTNGDVYAQLIDRCNNEISLLISGAIIGQDTRHGNRSKEETSIQLLYELIDADKKMVEQYMNALILPALHRHGITPEGASLRYKQMEDLEALWKKVVEVLPYKNVPNEYIKEKFGIEVTDKTLPPASQSAVWPSADDDFFDFRSV